MAARDERVIDVKGQSRTAASESRLRVARHLVERCPADLGDEIAVTGSVARGVADDHSDVELNLWIAEPPPTNAWRDWLLRAGASSIGRDGSQVDATGFAWTVCRLDGIWVEIGWAQTAPFDTFVSRLANGSFIGHERLQMGWTIQNAVPLRTSGRLAEWQSSLSRYPKGLAKRIVADQTEVWADPHVPSVRWGLAAREERMGLAMRFLWDMQNVLRVLFAVNHVWDHDLKWTDEASLSLPLQPSRLSQRIDAMFTLDDLNRAVEVNQRLIVETLELAQEQGFEVAEALTSMREGLRQGLEGTP